FLIIFEDGLNSYRELLNYNLNVLYTTKQMLNIYGNYDIPIHNIPCKLNKILNKSEISDVYYITCNKQLFPEYSNTLSIDTFIILLSDSLLNIKKYLENFNTLSKDKPHIYVWDYLRKFYYPI